MLYLGNVWLRYILIYNLKVSFKFHLTFLQLNVIKMFPVQRAKKVVSDSPELVDFAIGLVKSVFTLPDGQVMFFEEFK